MDYEVSGNETESTMETGSENAASTSHPTSQEMDVQQAEVLNLDDSDQEHEGEESNVAKKSQKKPKKHPKRNVAHKLEESKDLADLVLKYKKEYEEDRKKPAEFVNGKWRKVTNKQGYASKAAREYFPHLKGLSWSDSRFRQAKAVADRSVKNYEKLCQNAELDKKRFRVVGGGRKAQAPEVNKITVVEFQNAHQA